MPPLCADRLAEARSEIRLHEIRPDHGGALKTRHVRHLRVDLDFAIVFAELELLLRAKVLVTEEDNAALCDQKGEFVSLLVGEVFELKADDLGADVCGEVLDFFRGGEESCLVFVCAGAGIDVFSVLVPDGVDVLEEERAGWTVLWRLSVVF